MPSQWTIAGGPLMARRCVLAALETLAYDRAIKRRQYFVSKIWFVNLHLTFIRCCCMYIVDVNKDLIFFSFLRS